MTAPTGDKTSEGTSWRPDRFSSRTPTTAARMERAAMLEATGSSTHDIAEDLKLTDSAVREYRRDPEYRAAVQAARDEVYTATLGAALSRSSRAVAVLEDLMNDPEVEPQHRIRAAGVLLSQANRGHDITVLGEKLDEVRKTLGLD